MKKLLISLVLIAGFYSCNIQPNKEVYQGEEAVPIIRRIENDKSLYHFSYIGIYMNQEAYYDIYFDKEKNIMYREITSKEKYEDGRKTLVEVHKNINFDREYSKEYLKQKEGDARIKQN